MNLKPLGDRVIIKPVEAPEKTTGGIILPDTAKEKPQQGEVVAVGDGKVSNSGQKIPMNVKVKNKVLYGKYSGSEVDYEGETYLIMNESDIYAIVS